MRYWKYRYLYLMLLPCLTFFIVFSYIPLSGLLVAFKDYSFAKGIFQSAWESNHGMRNFVDFFNYIDSWSLIRNTFVTGLYKVVLTFPFPILLALMLNELRSVPFKRAVQTVSYMPYFISWTVVSIMLFGILSPDTGIVNQIMGFLGLPSDTFFMMEEETFYPILFLSNLWKNIGWNSIVYLAAITSINPELYEAAKVDGANKLSQIFHITLPGIKSTMGILFIMSLGQIVSTGFEQNYLLRTPGNMRISETLDVYVLMQGFQRGRYAYATAIGLLQGITAFVLVVSSNYLSRKYLEVSIW